jgi:dihydroorotate dehydrogenase
MDKGAVLAPGWFGMGFGWVEIGTVTPLPQPGNPRPRLFRLPAERALINRMGFNNDGAAAVARRLARLKARAGPICVNVGRNKATPNERAAEDYAAAARELGLHADILTINVSSPNTPGLRELQDSLDDLIRAVTSALPKRIPVLVKLSPDEPDDRLVQMAQAAETAGADGIIATNTTVKHEGEQGGLSGAPLKERAQAVCKLLYRSVKIPIVGVGGIGSAEDAYARIRAGASLIQLYTALIYEGPSLPRRINDGLAALLKRDGLTLREAIGRDA